MISWCRILAVLLALCLVAAGGKAAEKVKTHTTADADFEKLQTYRWLPAQTKGWDPRLDRGLFDSTVHTAADKVLMGKGYRRLDDGPVDFRIGFVVWVSDRVHDEMRYPSILSYRLYPSWGDGDGGPEMQYADTILLDVVDPAIQKVLWTGQTGFATDFTADRRRTERHIRHAVQKILRELPPRKP